MRMRAMALCVGAALLAVAVPRAMLDAAEPKISAVAWSDAVAAPAQDEDALELFDGVSEADVSSMRVAAPERSFSFERGADEVSVNGNEADKDAFDVLLDKVLELPVSEREAFAPGDAPILVVTLETANGEYSAAFYSDGQSGERALVLCGTQEEPSYRETEGWRVGTLLMACDGTRIFDADGNETVAQ